MKQLFFILIFTFSLTIVAQNEGQSFCKEFKDQSYFPLDIQKKKIVWMDAYYYEEIESTETIDGEIYIKFSQNWKAGNTETLFLREENGVIYQYEDCCENETVRFDHNFKKNDTWKTASGKAQYIIETYDGFLKTPYCDYKDILVIRAELANAVYRFYYKKGYGYIGATDENNNLVSYVSPEWN